MVFPSFIVSRLHVTASRQERVNLWGGSYRSCLSCCLVAIHTHLQISGDAQGNPRREKVQCRCHVLAGIVPSYYERGKLLKNDGLLKT
jgi:hypothetical protein